MCWGILAEKSAEAIKRRPRLEWLTRRLPSLIRTIVADAGATVGAALCCRPGFPVCVSPLARPRRAAPRIVQLTSQ